MEDLDKDLPGCSLAINTGSKSVKSSPMVLKGLNNRKRNLLLLASPRKNNGIKVTFSKQVNIESRKKKEVTGHRIISKNKRTVASSKLPAYT